MGHKPRHRVDPLYVSLDERTTTAASGVFEHRKPNVYGRLTWSPDLRTYRRFTLLIPYRLKRGSQSPTTELNRDDEGCPTSGYNPQPA